LKFAAPTLTSAALGGCQFCYHIEPALYGSRSFLLDFKACLFKRKKNQRYDSLLWHFFKVVKDKHFERLIKLCNGGKVTHFVNAINSRHRSALQTNYKITKISDNTWSVASNSLELDYLIKQNEPCLCKVICIMCTLKKMFC